MELILLALLVLFFCGLANCQLCQQLCISAGAALMLCSHHLTTLSVNAPYLSPREIVDLPEAIEVNWIGHWSVTIFRGSPPDIGYDEKPTLRLTFDSMQLPLACRKLLRLPAMPRQQLQCGERRQLRR